MGQVRSLNIATIYTLISRLAPRISARFKSSTSVIPKSLRQTDPSAPRMPACASLSSAARCRLEPILPPSGDRDHRDYS